MMEVILVVGVGEGVRVGFAIVGWFDLVLLVGAGTVMMINMIGLRGGYANVGYSSERGAAWRGRGRESERETPTPTQEKSYRGEIYLEPVFMLFMGAKAMGLGEGAAKVAMLITHPGEKDRSQGLAFTFF